MVITTNSDDKRIQGEEGTSWSKQMPCKTTPRTPHHGQPKRHSRPDKHATAQPRTGSAAS